MFDPRNSIRAPYEVRNEAAAARLIARLRWRNGEFCPRCKSRRRIYHFEDGRSHKCADCRTRFTLKQGTIFQDSKLPLSQCLAVIWAVIWFSKWPTARRLAGSIQISQKTAHLMLKKLRPFKEQILDAKFNDAVSAILVETEEWTSGVN